MSEIPPTEARANSGNIMKLGDSVDLIFNLLESVPAMGLTFYPDAIRTV